MADVTVLDSLIPEPGSFYLMDRGYVDQQRLFRIAQAGAFFVSRTKTSLRLPRDPGEPSQPSQLPGAAAPDPLQGPGDRQEPGLPDEQF